MKKRKKKVVKKPGEKKISFLNQRKNIDDKFFDLVNEKTKVVRQSKKVKGKRKPVVKFVRKGLKELASELEVSQSTLKRYISQGFINHKNDNLFINVERNFDKLKVKRTKQKTKQFTTHNFTIDNFFDRRTYKQPPPKRKIKSNETFFFKCGLYIQFGIKNFNVKGKKYTEGKYTIQNLPLSHYSDNYNSGFDEFFEIIKTEIDNHPSIDFFIFNYFDVSIIKID